MIEKKSFDVLHLLPSLTLYGGTPRKIHDLIKASPRPHGIYCWGQCPNDDDQKIFEEKFRDSDIPVYQGNFGRNFIKHVAEILRIIDSNGIRVVHGYFETGLLLASAVKLYRKDIATAVSFVGFPSETSKYRRLFVSVMVRYIDQLVYVSKFTKGKFENIYPSFKLQPTRIIYNGVNKRQLNTAINRNINSLQLITVSGLVDWKNIDVLLDAISLLDTNIYERLRLVIIGDGPEHLYLVTKAKNLKIIDRVDFVGYQLDVGGYLANSNIYLHPAIKEGFGLAVVEAMLMALPIIASNAGALPELLENGYSGLIVDPHDPLEWCDAITKLYQNPRMAEQLGINAKASAESKFTVGRFAAEHDDLYRQIAP